MICPTCRAEVGIVHQQRWDGDHTVMTEQHVCKCGWRGELRHLTEQEREAINKAVAEGSSAARLVQTRGVPLKDLPLAVRKRVQQQIEAAK